MHRVPPAGDAENASIQRNGRMSNLEHLLRDGFKSELMLKRQLRSLSETLRQQLQEAEERHRQELERRIHHNTLLSPDVLDHDAAAAQTIQTGLRRSTSTPVLTSHRGSSRPRPGTTSSSSKCERAAPLKPTQLLKQEEDEAECGKKFCARPVPGHVGARLYQEMVELREKERRRGHEQRRKLLLALQKPFSFQEREREKRERLMAAFSKASQDANEDAKNKPLRKNKETDPEPSRRVEVQAQRSPAPPTEPGPRAAERARREKLGFLADQPSFHPKIIQRVPDFSRLHRALQSEAQRTTQARHVTKCQPFSLRTSALPARQRGQSREKPQASNQSSLSRSKSLGALTSLSADTLPTYITDDVRRRGMAIRKSMETRDGENQGADEWSRNYQRRSEAMRKTVSLHAKLLDPHSSLREVYNEKLQRHREADQQRMREYTRDLRDMKARVKERPYLFQQVQQRNAMAHAEQAYKKKLKSAGVTEKFVEENGAGGFEDDGGAAIGGGKAEEENVDGWGEN